MRSGPAGKGAKLPLIELLVRSLPPGGAAQRERLLAAILCGDVLVDGERCREPKRCFPRDAELRYPLDLAPLAREAGEPGSADNEAIPPKPYVSRGGDKLESVLAAWSVPVAQRVWLDAGCSTGGFTHCLLLRGASLVHAVDVGYNQLDWRLRRHPRVRVHERTNIMALERLDPAPQAAVADLSFRSMEGAARRILELCAANELYALIKPQFERKYYLAAKAEGAGDEPGAIDGGEPGFAGVVSGHEAKAILGDLVRRLAAEDIALEALAPAGLKGRSGNQEYIALLRRRGVAGLDAGMDPAITIARGQAAVDRLFG